MTIDSSHFTIISGQGTRYQAGSLRAAAPADAVFKKQLATVEAEAVSKTDTTIPPTNPGDALSAAQPPSEQINGIKVDVDLNNDGIVDEQDLKLQKNAISNRRYDKAFDHNKDGIVNSRDADMLTALMGTNGTMIIKNPDLDQNGTLNLFDVVELLQNFGTNSAAHDLDGDGIVNERDVNLMVSFFPEAGGKPTA